MCCTNFQQRINFKFKRSYGTLPLLLCIFIIIIIIVQRVQYEQTTQCIENSAVRESYSETVQSVEIISLISDS